MVLLLLLLPQGASASELYAVTLAPDAQGGLGQVVAGGKVKAPGLDFSFNGSITSWDLRNGQLDSTANEKVFDIFPVWLYLLYAAGDRHSAVTMLVLVLADHRIWGLHRGGDPGWQAHRVWPHGQHHPCDQHAGLPAF